MKLTRLYPKGKRVIAEFDDAGPMLLAQDIALKFMLFPGLELSDEQLQEIRNEQEFFNAVTIADRFIAYRARSEREVSMKLRTKNIGPAIITRTIERLRTAGMLDDSDFAMRYVHDAMLKKPVGRIRMQQDLRRKGLSAEEIDAAMELQFTIEDETSAAVRLMEKRTKLRPAKNAFEQTQQMKSYLMSRGFSREAIDRAMHRNAFPKLCTESR